MTAKELKKWREWHLCIARPNRNGSWWVYDFKKKRQILKPYPGRVSGSKQYHETAPWIGYMADCCNQYNNFERIYLVNGKAAHESCATANLSGGQ